MNWQFESFRWNRYIKNMLHELAANFESAIFKTKPQPHWPKWWTFKYIWSISKKPLSLWSLKIALWPRSWDTRKAIYKINQRVLEKLLGSTGINILHNTMAQYFKTVLNCQKELIPLTMQLWKATRQFI